MPLFGKHMKFGDSHLNEVAALKIDGAADWMDGLKPVPTIRYS
jgi:hypothetical protein